jgi:hypothetical protein
MSPNEIFAALEIEYLLKEEQGSKSYISGIIFSHKYIQGCKPLVYPYLKTFLYINNKLGASLK